MRSTITRYVLATSTECISYYKVALGPDGYGAPIHGHALTENPDWAYAYSSLLRAREARRYAPGSEIVKIEHSLEIVS